MAMGNSYCHMCASHTCLHTMMGMAQQQMGVQQQMNQYYDHLHNIGRQSLAQGGGTVTVSSESTSLSSNSDASSKKPNKKLLLLLKR